MTALKRDGTALIPASLVNVLKGMGNLRPPNPKFSRKFLAERSVRSRAFVSTNHFFCKYLERKEQTHQNLLLAGLPKSYYCNSLSSMTSLDWLCVDLRIVPD